MSATVAEMDALLKALRDTLDDEFDALHQRDTERLATAVENKSRLLSELEDKARHLGSLGEAPPPQWQEMKTLLADCAKRNRVNGGAIALNRNLVAGLLQTLVGNQRNTPTYDASGKLGADAGARRVGRV